MDHPDPTTNPPLCRPLRIGLTGGIASGKSTVSGRFAQLGVPVFDADDIARALVEPGATGYGPVVEAFGEGILTGDGRIDRRRLRKVVFDDPDARRRLEAILHPLVRDELARRIDACTAPYCIAAVPLLIEAAQTDLVDRVLVVDAPEELQRTRLLQREGWSAEEADAVIRAQASRADRLAAADDVIENAGGVGDLLRAVDDLHARYRALAAQRD